MLPNYGRPLGGIPPVDGDFQDVDRLDTYQTLRRSLPPQSPPSTLSDKTFPRTKNRSRHEPGWVARPRNAFIIFRCEYSQIHRRQGSGIRRTPGTSTAPTLSKRAATAWRQMSREQKEPYERRAVEERTDHAVNHPEYRFRPQRRSSPSCSRHRNQRPSMSNSSSSSSLYPRNDRDIRDVPGPSTSSAHGGFPDLGLGFLTSTSDWCPPFACHETSNVVVDVKPASGSQPSDRGRLSTEISKLGLLDLPEDLPINHATSAAVIKNAAVILGWNRPTTMYAERQSGCDQATPSIDTVKTDVPIDHFPTSNYSADAQYTKWCPIDKIDKNWASNVSAEHPIGSDHPSIGCQVQPIAISTYTTLDGAVLDVPRGATNHFESVLLPHPINASDVL